MKTMNGVRNTLIAGMIMLLCSTIATAQWVQTSGPSGARFAGVTADETTRIAIVGNEVLNYENQTWTTVGSLPEVEEVARHREGTPTMTIVDGALLVHHRGNLLRSTDYGKSFTNITTSSALVTDGSDFYTITDDVSFQTGTSIAHSTDGVTFTVTGELPGSSSAPALYDGSLYSAFGYGGKIFRSDDKGENWTEIDVTLPREGRETSAGGGFIMHMVGTDHGLYTPSGAEVFFSTDGETWTNVSANLPQPLRITRISANNDYVYIATQSNESFRYSPESETWTKLEVSDARDVISTPQGAVVMTVSGGILGFDGEATEGTDLDGGLIRSTIYAMGAVDDVVLANAQGFVYRSADAGKSWDRVDALAGWNMVTFSTNEATGEIYMLDGSPQFGVPMRSDDKGLTWEEFGPMYEFDNTWRREDVHTIVSTDDAIFAAISLFGPSKANGAWRAGGVYRSDDGGESWKKVDNGLPRNVETTVPIADMIEIDGNLIVTTVAGTYRSDNDGNSWTPAMNGISGADMERKGGQLFTVGSTLFKKMINGFYRSDDYGQSWQAIELDLPTGLEYTFSVFSLDGEIYMQSYKLDATAPLGYFDYYLLKFDGTEWKDVTDWQPEGVLFTDMVRSGDLYYAGTSNHGVWTLSRDFSIGSASVHEDRGNRTIGLELSAAPNPTTDRLALTISSAERTEVRVTLTDPKGEKIEEVHAGTIGSGSTTFEIETTVLAVGTYYVNVTTADGSRSVAPIQVLR